MYMSTTQTDQLLSRIEELEHENLKLKSKLRLHGIPVKMTKTDLEHLWRKSKQTVNFIKFLLKED